MFNTNTMCSFILKYRYLTLIPSAITLCFIVLKVTNIISWSWLIVFMPTIVEGICFIIFIRKFYKVM